MRADEFIVEQENPKVDLTPNYPNYKVLVGEFIGIKKNRARFLIVASELKPGVRETDKIFRDEAMNAYGFNSGFRREQGLSVEGFNHPPGTNEDGWLALKLREKGYGKLFYVTNIKALVWTTDRRIQIDGGLFKGTIKRLKRMIGL